MTNNDMADALEFSRQLLADAQAGAVTSRDIWGKRDGRAKNGGKRAGAGRPKRLYTIRLTDEQIQALERITARLDAVPTLTPDPNAPVIGRGGPDDLDGFESVLYLALADGLRGLDR